MQSRCEFRRERAQLQGEFEGNIVLKVLTECQKHVYLRRIVLLCRAINGKVVSCSKTFVNWEYKDKAG